MNTKYRKNLGLAFLILLFVLLASCSRAEPENLDIILATTTSTRDSGLLDVLVPDFEEKSGYIVKTVAVGTGKALAMGEQGDADLLFVHAPAAEEEFMDAGFGSERWLVMHNDFVLVGPSEDPAGINGSENVVNALNRISESGGLFVSRGDDSGTHKKELGLWEKAGVNPEIDRYLESGQGMSDTLRIASEKGAYTLTDRATYLANNDTLSLEILFEGDPELLNIYHVIIVNPQKWPRVNEEGAQAFANFVISPEVQEKIATFGVDKYGQPLFFPDAGKSEEELGLQ
jgi:tungstate transport system substrate-binding protein